MGNIGAAGVSGGSPLVRPFEERCRVIEETLPVTYIESFGRPGWETASEPFQYTENDLSGSMPCWGSSPITTTGEHGGKQRASFADYSLQQPSTPVEYETYADVHGGTTEDTSLTPLSARVSGARTRAASMRQRISPSNPQQSSQPTSSNELKEKMDRMIASSRVKIPVYGVVSNHIPFLEPQIFEHVLPFIFDNTLVTCMKVCPHWYRAIYVYLKYTSAPIVKRFIDRCCNSSNSTLTYINSTLSVQPLFTATASAVRIDVLIYAAVNPAANSTCTQLGYSFRYGSLARPNGSNVYSPEAAAAGNVLPPQGSSFCPASDNDRTYQHLFRFETRRKGSSRTLWLQRDLCRFHGDEIMVARLPVVPTVCVGDLIEIPVTVSNAFGLVEVDSIEWDIPIKVPDSVRLFGQSCEYEGKELTWTSLEEFQKTTSERLEVNDIFAPQWDHRQTVFTGIDIAISRSSYIAKCEGSVPHSRRWLGIDCVVVNRNSPVIVPLTRLGLQHDRFNKLQARLGDKIVLYISQGGGIVQ